ncbi:MAG: T9SS type A sorting domain-containing protein [bacterium]
MIIFIIIFRFYNNYEASNKINNLISPLYVEKPEIIFTFIPPYGNNSKLQGKVIDVDPQQYEIVLYIFIEGNGWWTKPTFANPLIAINSDSSWNSAIFTSTNDIYATEIIVFLMKKGKTPFLAAGVECLPDSLFFICAAQCSIKRKMKTISFAGYEWLIKKNTGKIGPGPNYFSDTTDNVFVDANNELHLSIKKRNTKWYCSEVILNKSLGYGEYYFKIRHNLNNLNENAILGIFLWDNSACESNFNEFDIEFSRWGIQSALNNAQYVIQPYNKPGNRKRWQMPDGIEYSLHGFKWQNDTIDFFSSVAHNVSNIDSSIISKWRYSGDNVPDVGKENVRINLWLLNGIPPTDDKNIEIIISSFEFIPQKNDTIITPPIQKTGYILNQNYPNPFNLSTIIEYHIPCNDWINIKIYDILGKEIETIQNSFQQAGNYKIKWYPYNISSGIYIYKLFAGGVFLVKKMIIIK